MATVLPPEWKSTLTSFNEWLNQTSVELDARDRAFRDRFPVETERPAANGITEREPRLAGPEFEAVVQAAETEALEADAALRGLVGRAESLRLRLAEGVGRAIG